MGAENMKLVQGAKIIYSAGFFITVSTESMKLAQAEAAKSGAKYCLNLSAPFLMMVPPFKSFILESLPMVDYLFCNETEAATFAETEGWETRGVILPCWPLMDTSQNTLSWPCPRRSLWTRMALEMPMLVASWQHSLRACQLPIAARQVHTQRASL